MHDREYTQAEAIEYLKDLTKKCSTYPQGQPVDVTVTLTDEQWNAVNYALGTLIVASLTKGAPQGPILLIEQMKEAQQVISRLNADAVLGQAGDELVEEIEKEMKE